jgi:sec-independent protein translocase protein TatA
MGSFSPWHWLVVLLIVVLVFGTGKLRNLGKDLGGAIKGFKEGMREGGSEEKPPPQHVTDASASGTIDVQAKEKSGP